MGWMRPAVSGAKRYRQRGRYTIALVALVVLGMAGCGNGLPKTYKVNGKVLVAGKPAPGARIMFHPLGENKLGASFPKAQADNDGAFSVTTFNPGDGAPAGQYKVTVAWCLPPGATTVPNDPDVLFENPDRLQGRYGTAEKTPLTITIETAANELPPFELQ